MYEFYLKLTATLLLNPCCKATLLRSINTEHLRLELLFFSIVYIRSQVDSFSCGLIYTWLLVDVSQIIVYVTTVTNVTTVTKVTTVTHLLHMLQLSHFLN